MRKAVFFYVLFCMNILGIVMQVNGQTNNVPLPSWINDFRPDDVLWGIGRAKTESDGESILLAEDRARIEIARQLSKKVKITTSNYSGTITEETAVRLNGSRVIRREKTSDGAWWCCVELSKALHGLSKIAPQHGGIDDISKFNLTSFFRRITEQSNMRTIAAIPDWVLNPIQHQPEDRAWGLGAAKLGSDDESISLARERARRSLAYSLDTEVSSVFHSYAVGDAVLYEEDIASIISDYNHTIIVIELTDMVKTRDGTWWVLLGCPIY